MEENKNFDEILNKAKELETIDFKSVEEFNHEEYYRILEKISVKNNTLKREEAENLIKEQEDKIIDSAFVKELSKKKESILNLIRRYDPNSEMVKNMSEHDVDKVYGICTYLQNVYIQYLNEMTFNFELSVEELKFLNKILTRIIEYNGDDVFNYVEFYENFWINVIEEYEMDKSKSTYIFKPDIKKILILHHLIKNYRVKGNTDEFRHFRNVLYKIAQTNKLFNAYNIVVERIKDDCKLWGISLDEVFTQKNNQKELESEVIQKEN